MNGFLRHVLGAFVRLFGVAVAVVGAFVAVRSLETGASLFLFGVAFALRPHFLGRAATWVKILIE